MQSLSRFVRQELAIARRIAATSSSTSSIVSSSSSSSKRAFSTADDDLGYQTVNRRPYNVEAKLRMKQYRREAEEQRRQMELEEEARTFQLDYTKMYKIGDPGTVVGVIKEVNNVGYFVTLPNGREGFLSAMHLGCSGGIPLLERLMKPGTEIALRVIPVPHPGGRDRCYVRAIGSSI